MSMCACSGMRGGKTEEAIARSEALHELLWTQATAAAEKDTGSIMTGVFIQSLNEVIDLHAKRVLVGMRSRIPVVIWVGLFGLAMLGMAAVGYQAGLVGDAAFARHARRWCWRSRSCCCSIADLDRGQEGLLRVSQQSMIDLQKSMQPASPRAQHQEPAP